MQTSRKGSRNCSSGWKLNSITIATNMAGRGTDIVLGGNPEYMAKTDMKKN